MTALSPFLRESIIATTTEVLVTMLGVEVTPHPAGNALLPESGDDRVMAILGLAGALSGSGVLVCTPTLAADLTSRMLMQEYRHDGRSMHNDVLDAIGELANMIVGGVKTNLEERYGPMGMSIPNVVYGHNFRVRNSVRENLHVGFDCCRQRLDVCIGLVEQHTSLQHSSAAHSAAILSLQRG